MESHFDVNNSTNYYEIQNFDPQETASNNVNAAETLPTETQPIPRKDQARKIDEFIKNNYEIIDQNLVQSSTQEEIKPHKAVIILLGDRHKDDTIAKMNATTVNYFHNLVTKDKKQSSLNKVFTEGGKLEGHKNSQAYYINNKVEIDNWDTYEDVDLANAGRMRREILGIAEEHIYANMNLINGNILDTESNILKSKMTETNNIYKLCRNADNNFFTAMANSNNPRNTELGLHLTETLQQNQRKIIVIAGSQHLNFDNNNNPIRNSLSSTGKPYIVLTPKKAHENHQNDIQEMTDKIEQKEKTLVSLSKQEQLNLLKNNIEDAIEKIKIMPTELVNDIGSKMMEVESVLKDQSTIFSLAKQIRLENAINSFELENQKLMSASDNNNENK